MATLLVNMWRTFVCLLLIFPLVQVARQKNDQLQKVDDVKDWKKLLRTKTNVLAIFGKTDKALTRHMSMFNEVADVMKGLATIVYMNCDEDKKLCKKIKASPDPIEIKHFKDGDFNKNYDRKETIKSMVSFLRDPTGDLPWEEDSAAADVYHIDDFRQLNRLLIKEKKSILIMFYAPWCGFCKKIKPEFAMAATELRGHSILAGIDVDKPENVKVRVDYNITGFPTLLYFEEGKLKFKYGGENNKDGLVTWMKNPSPPKDQEKQDEWEDVENEVIHLKDRDFDSFVKENPSVLVMFYAPWCGHCKTMKPEYESAAAKLKDEGIEGTLAAVDATKEKSVAGIYKIKGFPTVKYFKNGEPIWDFNERTADKILEFMKEPKEPLPPPPAEPEWSDIQSQVVHLDDGSFKQFIKKKKHVLVMFYAPWCGHCKKAKPEFMEAAADFGEDNKVIFSAVDCTKHTYACADNDVSGYPTFKYFNYGKNEQKYAGGREKSDFINFMKDPTNPLAAMPAALPAPEQTWNDITGNEHIHHLSEANFDEFISQNSRVLVMFYAPWCGHCKAMKPAYGEAATIMKENGVPGVLAAVDATVETSLSQNHQVKGFPTLKFFTNGKISSEYNSGRKSSDLVAFMKNTIEKAVPAVETKWADEPSEIHHLDVQSFDTFIADKTSVLVMFYAPWCGHCKKAKPEFEAAGKVFVNSNNMYLAAVDCTVSQEVCSTVGITGYPTFKYFSKGKYLKKYEGGRSTEEFLNFLNFEISSPGKNDDAKVEL